MNAMPLYFGVFDHVDRGAAPLAQFYEDRLKLVEAYDRHGFHVYLVAEHHATPLGMAPSPSVFLSAVAQRTKRLRFGPLVYALPLYNPLRLVEEICMLDQMSGGRFEFGVGKGISPIETAYYGVDPAQSEAMFAEAYDVVLRGLAGPTLTYAGRFYRFQDVPLELEPLQKPHPPLWYGANNPASAARAASRGMSVVANMPAAALPAIGASYWPAYKASGAAAAPKLGMNRHLVLAEREDEALAIARRAYRRWFASFMQLWRKHDRPPVGVNYPPEIDGFLADGRAVVGTPDTVRAKLQAQLEEAGVNYLGCRFAFGDLSLAESLRSVELFARQVMPQLEPKRAAAE
jgi:alkanesulfonate monooxygenase SsuD/methylene tetrahydromethanopterin reductase-like flavin-dependent oxidoreductase (luciferase family)